MAASVELCAMPAKYVVIPAGFCAMVNVPLRATETNVEMTTASVS